MLSMEDYFDSWSSNISATLHQVSYNGSYFGCAYECDINPNSFDRVCTIDHNATTQPLTFLCKACDYTNCPLNVSLVLNGLENIKGVFLARISNFNDCGFSPLENVILECSLTENLIASQNPKDLSLFCSYKSKIDTLTRVRRYDWKFLFVTVFIVAGGLGNILVCLAVALDRQLHNLTNYFLLSLAVADLLVSLFVMPLGAIPAFLGYWPFSIVWCNIYVTCDVLACSASIMHMCFISLSRYVGIRNPLRTRRTSTKRLVVFKIAAVWLLAMLVSSSITILGMINPRNIMPEAGICVINNRAFFVLGSLVAFYIPMIVMVITYVLTMHLLRKKARFIAECLEIEQFQKSNNRNSSIKLSITSTTISSSIIPTARTSIQTTRPGWKSSSDRINIGTGSGKFLASGSKGRVLAAKTVASKQKASKVLGIVFFTFVLCWTPFFVLNILFATCPECSVPRHIVDTCLWLGYVSSTINPIIYTIFNKTFRIAFFRLLKCKCSRSGRPLIYISVKERERSTARDCVPEAPPLKPNRQQVLSLVTAANSASNTALGNNCLMIMNPIQNSLCYHKHYVHEHNKESLND